MSPGTTGSRRERGEAASLLRELGAGGLFPLRFLGFGFFWAWLFLATLSPSPLFGVVRCVGNIPFEMFELGARTVLLVGTVAISRWLATASGCRTLLVASVVCGIATTPCCLLATPWSVTLGAILAAVADVAMFLLWLSFFGYMRLGDTLALLVLSYGAGSLLFLGLLALGTTVLVAASMGLPLLSGAAFVLSRRLQGSRTGVPLFESTPQRHADSTSAPQLRGPRARMTVALGFYSSVFALFSGLSVASSNDGSLPVYLVEPVAIVALTVIYLVKSRRTQGADSPYRLYRAVPLLVGAGPLLMILGAPPFCACACVALGYVLFEVLALNDYCNLVHTEDASLLKSMAVARLAISAGMALGWAVAHGSAALSPTASAPAIPLVACALFLVVPVATLLFTGRDVSLMNALADDRAASEAPIAEPSRQERLERFAQERGFSKREGEVFAYLVEGRSANYIATKLCVAESTVRAHVHSIYRKAQVNSRMELLDAFAEA